MAKYIKGLFKDTAHIDQPQGTWRYAKNMNIHPVSGAMVNEEGNDALALPLEGASGSTAITGDTNNNVFPPASIIVGHIETTDDRIVIFITYDRSVDFFALTDPNGVALSFLYGTDATPIYNSEIGIWENGVYTTLYRPLVTDGATDIESGFNTNQTRLDLNFNREHFIEGTYKINPDGELFVYWTDDLNPPRAFNVTRQLDWINEQSVGVPTNRLYGIDHLTSSNLHHNEMLNLFPSAGPVPHVELNSIKAGGGLRSGVYYLALAYVDVDLVKTNYLVIANPVSIVEDVEGVLPIERYDGAEPLMATGKSISWDITNINGDYAYVRPAVIRKANGARTVFRLNDIPTANLTTFDGRNQITFTGLEDASEGSVSDIIIDTPSYETAKTINQLDGILYLGNVKGTRDLGYQKYANFIKSHPVVKAFPNFDPREYTLDVLDRGYIESSPFGGPHTIKDGYRSSDNIYKYKGYQRDEVYAFYIAFILNDGTESYAYHIPGREQLQVTTDQAPNITSWFYGNGASWGVDTTTINDAGDTILISSGNLPLWALDNNCTPDPITGLNTQCMETQDVLAPTLFNMSDGAGRMFHFYETSGMDDSRNMNFWQNTTEFYPADDVNGSNWEIWDAEELGISTDYGANNLQGQRIRHHHFPSNENEDFKTILGIADTVDIAISEYKREWRTIDFAWCTNNEFTSTTGLWSTSSNSIEGAMGGTIQNNWVADPDCSSNDTLTIGAETFDCLEITDTDALDLSIGQLDSAGSPDEFLPDGVTENPDYNPNYGNVTDSQWGYYTTEPVPSVVVPGGNIETFLQDLGLEVGGDYRYFGFSNLGETNPITGLEDGAFYNADPDGYPKVGEYIEWVWVKHGNWAGSFSDNKLQRIAGSYSPSDMYGLTGSDPATDGFYVDCINDITTWASAEFACSKLGDQYIQGGHNKWGITHSEHCTTPSDQAAYGTFPVLTYGNNVYSASDSNQFQTSANWYFPLGCVRQPKDSMGTGCFSKPGSRPLRKRMNNANNGTGLGDLLLALGSLGTAAAAYNLIDDRCTDGADCMVLFAEQNWVIVECNKPSATSGGNCNYPDVGNNPLWGSTQPHMINGWMAWSDGATEIQGTISHNIQALGIQFEDIKVPPEVWEKTQGFRIYYAKRRHEDKRILGQNLVNPYAPTWEEAFPGCASAESIGNASSSVPVGVDMERMWVNWPYPLPSYAYQSIRYFNEDITTGRQEYQGFSFHDFYLSRSKRSLAAATHIKVEYGVEMLPLVGPGITHNCWRQDFSSEAIVIQNDPESPDYTGGAPVGYHEGGGGSVTDFVVRPSGATDCTAICVQNNIMNGMFVGYNYYSPAMNGSANGGGTQGQNMYQWLAGVPSSEYPTFTDTNRVLKERCKTYLKGDSIYNGKQLGFGYKTYNDFGESHMSMLLHEDSCLRAFSPEKEDPGMDSTITDSFEGTISPWIRTETEPGLQFQAIDLDASGDPKPVNYLANLHAFRLDMYNSVDTQDLVWTGYEVTGVDYKKFWVNEEGDPVIDDTQGALTMDINPETITDSTPIGTAYEYNDLGNGKDTQNADQVSKFKTGHVFGGDTFIARYGYRKTLRNNLKPGSATVGANGNVDDLTGGYDMRYLYDIIVESTDNINFRHILGKPNFYYPAAPAKDILTLDSIEDLTKSSNMKYNEDYSSENDIGHTVPLPLQIAEPESFPTRVLRSVKSDDTNLIDTYRIFKALQFKDLPKNRGSLWKISTFNNLLYLHMQDSLFKTLGKQKMQLSDSSEAFVGGGDIFAQNPEELVQTNQGYGGTQSQWATTITKSGYFFLDQRARRIYLATNELVDISSIGMEKWFQTNLAYNLEAFGKNSFDDNPLSFGFHAVWDEKYQRVLLTKRELSPTARFARAYSNYQYKVSSALDGYIKYNPETDSFEYSSTTSTWEPLEINEKTAIEKQGMFYSDGWTVSYYPRLKIWSSFHDYVPYRYMSTSKSLFSARLYNPLQGQITPGDDPFTDQTNWIHRIMWEHNSLTNKGDYYGSISEQFIGEVKSNNYSSELEVVHNEGKNLSKLFHNFSFIADTVIQNVTDYENLKDYEDNKLKSKTVDPGFSSFILYNTHQCSGEIAMETLINARKNGGEWHINKFRDIADPNVQTNIVGGANTAAYYSNHFMNQTNAMTFGGAFGASSSSITGSFWLADGMYELLSDTLLNPTTTTPKKFVDKFIAIRLIISNLNNNLVTLYSTKVGVRKFYRDE